VPADGVDVDAEGDGSAAGSSASAEQAVNSNDAAASQAAIVRLLMRTT
jgi:hypothetical protein